MSGRPNQRSPKTGSTVSSPGGLLKVLYTRFALPGRPVHSDTNWASPGSILAMQQLRTTTKSLAFPPLPIARDSFIQLSQLGRQWRERKYPIFETVAKGDSNPGSLDCESGILPLSYRAPHVNSLHILRVQIIIGRVISLLMCFSPNSVIPLYIGHSAEFRTGNLRPAQTRGSVLASGLTMLSAKDVALVCSLTSLSISPHEPSGKLSNAFDICGLTMLRLQRLLAG